jgi:phosphohistidine swiveling domain-containing protein
MRELALLRRLLLAVGARTNLGTGVFDLTPAEVAQLGESSFRQTAVDRVQERRRRREVLLDVHLPPSLTPAVLESLGEPGSGSDVSAADLRGECVAGNREVVGRVRVFDRPDRLDELEPGEILVTRCTDPCWLPAFRRAGGLVTEIGGWLSHAAIQAREHDLPTIVGAVGATSRLRDGQLVRLCRNGDIELVAEQRCEERQGVDARARLRWAGATCDVRVLDVSQRGACLEVATRTLPSHGDFSLLLEGHEVEVAVAWTNCHKIGVAFAAPLVRRPESLVTAAG